MTQAFNISCLGHLLGNFDFLLKWFQGDNTRGVQRDGNTATFKGVNSSRHEDCLAHVSEQQQARMDPMLHLDPQRISSLIPWKEQRKHWRILSHLLPPDLIMSSVKDERISVDVIIFGLNLLKLRHDRY